MRIVLVLAALTLTTIATTVPAGATTYESACPPTEAHARVDKAVRALHRAEARLAEARRVLTATRTYSGQYGESVGRWVWLSRRVGWPWAQMPTLMMVVDRESGGDPAAWSGYYAGLLQFGEPWYLNKWDPFSPQQNLLHGRQAWQKVQWQPWGL